MLTSNELNTLTSILSKLTVSAPRNRNRRRRPVKALSPQVPAPANNRNKRKKKKKNASKNSATMSGTTGSIRLKRDEFLATVTGKSKNVIDLYPSSTVFPFLYGLTKCYERIVWHSMRIHYKTASGTTKDGMITMGIDWNSNAKVENITKSQVQSYTPNCEFPVWIQSKSMVLPSSRLMSRKEYIIASKDVADKQPGQLVVFPGGEAYEHGDLWVEYDVSLHGTTAA